MSISAVNQLSCLMEYLSGLSEHAPKAGQANQIFFHQQFKVVEDAVLQKYGITKRKGAFRVEVRHSIVNFLLRMARSLRGWPTERLVGHFGERTLDALSAMDKVTMCINAPSQPVVLTESEYVHVIMPMHVRGK